jgi:subtilisin family serine protease
MEGLLSDAVRAYSHLLRMLQQPRQPGEALSLVVNNSWGMYNPGWDLPVGHPGNYSDNSDHTFNRLVRTLVRAGADILFAAGNCGADCPARDCENVVDRAIYGANGHPQVLCVGGVDVTGARVGYSSIGPARLSPDKPDICGFTHFAGSGVYAADSGTSAATPVVAGVVAAYRTRVPSGSGATPADVGDLLRRTAVKVEGSGFDHQTGWGIVNGCGISSTPVPGSQEVADAVDQLAMKMEATA